MMRRIRTVAVLPTLFTLGNLVCGFFAVVVASRIPKPQSAEILPDQIANLMLCGWLIFLAMVFDALDGHVARMAKTTSDFGAQLDSLCDVVTFGVAPAILLVKMCPSFSYAHPQAIWFIAALYTACAALRLARFNVETGQDVDHMNFSGLPTPAAAAVIAGFAILSHTLHEESASDIFKNYLWWMQIILPLFSALIALLMVSRIPYPHVVNQIFREQRSFAHVVKLVFALAVVMIVRGYAVPIICCAFVMGPPLRHFWNLAFSRQRAKEPLF